MWMSMEMVWVTNLIQVKADLGQRFLVSSAGRALRRYRRGHGFKSRTGLNFFSGLIFTIAQVLFITARVTFIFTPLSAVQIYDLHIFTVVYIYGVVKPLHIYIPYTSLYLSIYLLSINIEVWRVKSISSSLGKSEGRSPQPHRLTNVCNEFWGKSFWRKYTAASVGGIKNNWILSTELIK